MSTRRRMTWFMASVLYFCLTYWLLSAGLGQHGPGSVLASLVIARVLMWLDTSYVRRRGWLP